MIRGLLALLVCAPTPSRGLADCETGSQCVASSADGSDEVSSLLALRRTPPPSDSQEANTSREWGPPGLQSVCQSVYGDLLCVQYGSIPTPVDYDSGDSPVWDQVYFVNSKYWRPDSNNSSPIFLQMMYGVTDPEDYLKYVLMLLQGSRFDIYGISEEDLSRWGALLILVPNRYFGCQTAQEQPNASYASCPVNSSSLPEGEAYAEEALERLKYLSMTSVVNDMAFVGRETVTTFANDWGLQIGDSGRATNPVIAFGCSWPGAAATYARLLYPDVFHAAIASGNPLVSSAQGNPWYTGFLSTSAYAAGAAGGSVDCLRVIQRGHEEIGRRIMAGGTWNKSKQYDECVTECYVNPQVNLDFFGDAMQQLNNRSESDVAEDYYPFGEGVLPLYGVQSQNKSCEDPMCNVEKQCKFLVECHGDRTEATGKANPEISYDCLKEMTKQWAEGALASQGNSSGSTDEGLNSTGSDDGSLIQESGSHPRGRRGARRRVGLRVDLDTDGDGEVEEWEAEGSSMCSAFRTEHSKFQELGPKWFSSQVLVDQMFGFNGPLWMMQTCNDDSLCPFVQGVAGGLSRRQRIGMMYAMYSSPDKPFDEFSERMSAEAEDWHAAMGGAAPWEAFPNASRIFWIYNGIDPWTSNGVVVNTVPEGRDLYYELGLGPYAHCQFKNASTRPELDRWIAGGSPP